MELWLQLTVHGFSSKQLCPKCGISFHSGSLKRHIEMVHENMRPFKCPSCDQCFSAKVRSKPL